MNRIESTLVTVLMPFRNANFDFFRAAVASVFAQSTPFWNLILIHDEDEQTTAELVEEVKARKDNRVRIEMSHGKRITGALNTGMKQALTPYVCSLHCDDLLAQDAIETLNRAILENPTVDFFYSSRRFIDGNGKPKGNVMQAVPFTISDFKEYGPVKHLHCWKVQSALQIGGMDESFGLHGGDDYDFPWCMAEAGFSFKTIPECLYYYRDHRKGYRLTTHVPLETQIQEICKILRKHGLSEQEIQQQIQKRKKTYLRQALYKTEADRIAKPPRWTRLWKA
jgi:glycosyltransferase involved in cell wall biosynthesis